ncbi:hypothetical protein WBG06_15355 [Nocardioides sp. CCNWLW239]|uniref:hypothetical protein n=1 Tax=Nocardioides sp. CCNWLW239 TaxID=3128902 RepID=UPI003016E423
MPDSPATRLRGIDLATVVTALGAIDITGPMEPVLGGLAGSRTAQATLWLSTRLAAAVRSYADGLAALGTLSEDLPAGAFDLRLSARGEDYVPPADPPGLALVGGWSTSALREAARRVHEAAEIVDAHLREVPAALREAAPAQIDEEVRSGRLLLTALRHARWAMHEGSVDLDAALAELTDATARAATAGFAILEDATVTEPDGVRIPAPRLPEGAESHTARIAAALDRVVRTDASTADALTAISFPESLGSRIAAYVERVVVTRQVVASLGEEGAGALSAGKVAKSAGSVVGKGSAYLRFLRTSLVGLTRSQTVFRSVGTTNRALRQFARGSANGGALRFLLGTRLARGVGWIFLPLTIVTGVVDVVTGSGERGVRGLVNRLLGLAGAVGAAVLLVTQLRWAAAGPGVLSVAGAAVLAFSLWSLGTMAWDHRAGIASFANAVASRLRTARAPSRSAGRARRGRP